MRRSSVTASALLASTLIATCGDALAGATACARAAPIVAPVARSPSVAASGVGACVVAPAALARSAHEPMLIDARRGGGLRAAIPGALAFDADAIDPRPPFEANAAALLIGDAGDVRRLAGVCATLQARGYAKLRVLAGGFDAWRRLANGSGNLQRPPAIPMTAGALGRQAAAAPRTIVFDANADAGLHRLGGSSNVAGRSETPVDAARRIAKDLRRRGVVPGVDPIVVVLAERAAIDAWRDAWDATAYPDPQFYIGADEQFRADLARDERIAAERGKPLPGPCDR